MSLLHSGQTGSVRLVNFNFKYREYKLDEHFDRFAFYEEFGGNATFPQVQLNGVKLGGCTDTVKYLKEHNLLDGSRRHTS